MAVFEGARRIKLIGKIFIVFGGFVALVLWLVALSSGTMKVGPFEQLAAFMFLPLLVGGTMWIGGWILEGFAKQSDVGRQMRQP
jgi:hypothetical protein